MLVLTRRNNESILIDLAPEVDPSIPVGALFEKGPIEIIVHQRSGGETQLIIRADLRFRVLRKELAE